MRILYISQYFPPETGATQTRAYEMASNLVRMGHHVTMLTEIPNHPAGIIPPEYRGKLYERVDLDGIEVIRVWVKASPVKNFRSRMFFYLSFMLNAVLGGLLLARGKYDLIYATSPPLFVGGAALILSILRRTPLVFEVRDLWPESAVALGELTQPLAIRWATKLERACYNHSLSIVVTTQEMAVRLIERGFPGDKINVIYNGSNIALFKFDALARTQIRSELEMEDKYLVVYAGLLGIAQSLDTALEAAKLLQEKNNTDIHFLIIGDGPTKNELQETAREMQLYNVSFLPMQPRELIPSFLCASDLAFVPLTRKRLIGALPSKMFDAMACERPVLLSAEGEARVVLQDANAGMWIRPGDPHAIVEAVLLLRDNSELCVKYGENGRCAVVSRFSRQAQAQQLERMLTTIL